MRTIDEMIPQTYISRRLYESVKLSSRRMCDLAVDAGLDASTLSLVLHRRRKVRLNDPRFLELGRILGLEKTQCFEPVKKVRNGRGKKVAA